MQYILPKKSRLAPYLPRTFVLTMYFVNWRYGVARADSTVVNGRRCAYRVTCTCEVFSVFVGLARFLTMHRI